MFQSFFPRPKLLFLSFAVWSVFGVLLWYFVLKDMGGTFSLGWLFGYGAPAPLADAASDAAKAAFEAQTSHAATFWFYEYFIVMILLFVGFWRWFSPHPWFWWSVAGSALIVFVDWFLVELNVMINEWFGSFYDLVQTALGKPDAITAGAYYGQLTLFLKIALAYVFVATLFRFFVSHYIFRWRTALNDFYAARWERLRNIEGASQRVQEDTMRFASISEDLGISFVDSVLTLIAFLPLLWGLSAHVKELPIIGPVSQGLVFVAILWSVVGTGLLAVAGIRLPGLEFRNQRVEAAYRKELVIGEDNPQRAQPPTLAELFSYVRKNYFRLYLNYLYFNLVRIFYLQAGVLVPYVALAPTIVAGTITLGVMQQIVRAFGQVESSFQYLVNSWTTIVDLLSVYKRLAAFEAMLAGGALNKIETQTFEGEGGIEPAG